MRYRFSVLLTLASALLAAPPIHADAPPEPKNSHARHCPLNGRWCVEGESTRGSGFRIVEQRGKEPHSTRWTLTAALAGWPAFTNDGACVVDMATGSNRLEPAIAPGDAAFVFHCQGRPPIGLAIGRFIADFEALPRSPRRRHGRRPASRDRSARRTTRRRPVRALSDGCGAEPA